MNIGTETNSVINHCLSSSNDEPQVGLGCTLLHWTDRSPATIIQIVSDKIIRIQLDDYKRTDKNGISESQSYEYIRNLQGAIYFFKRQKNGSWKEVYWNPETKRFRNGSTFLSIGRRERYYDPSF
ncbi:MAG: hypothetical protein HQK56_16245 [Deltaproteobacteria bacterium]|nr:hypothetical protein [Deltaproteobacteria bacterium]